MVSPLNHTLIRNVDIWIEYIRRSNPLKSRDTSSTSADTVIGSIAGMDLSDITIVQHRYYIFPTLQSKYQETSEKRRYEGKEISEQNRSTVCIYTLGSIYTVCLSFNCLSYFNTASIIVELQIWSNKLSQNRAWNFEEQNTTAEDKIVQSASHLKLKLQQNHWVLKPVGFTTRTLEDAACFCADVSADCRAPSANRFSGGNISSSAM